MSVYPWCSACQAREPQCSNQNSHKASRAIQYRADFMVGGRYGTRIRKLFTLKKDADSYEYVTMADYKRGQFIPDQHEKSKTMFSVFIEEYRKDVDKYMDGADIEGYRLDQYLKAMPNKPLKHFTVADGDDLVNWYLNRKLEKTTINRNLTSWKCMFKWAVDQGYLKSNPMEKVKKFKVDGKRKRWLNDFEINELLRACELVRDFDMKDIFIVALNTGFRKDNLETVTAKDILPNNRLQALKTKQKETYDVPISSTLSKVLKKLVTLRPAGPLLNFRNFRRRFDLVIEKSGLMKPSKDPEKITLHTFRHTFISQGLKKGIPISTLSKWADHYSIDFTLKHYGHLCPNQEQIEMSILNLGSVDSNYNVDTLLTSNTDKLEDSSQNS